MSIARAGSRRILLAGVAALGVLVVTVPGAYLSRQLTHERRAAADDAALGAVTGGLVRDLEGLIEGVTAASERPQASGGQLGTSPGVVGVTLLPASGRPEPTGAAELGPEIIEGLEVALGRARDTGEVQLGPTIDARGGAALALLAPRYPPSAAGPPRTTAARRAAFEGWVVALVDLGAVAARHVPPGMVAQVADGPVTYPAAAGAGSGAVSAPVSAPARLPERDLDLGGHRVTVHAGDPAPVPIALGTLLLGVGGVVLAVVAAATTVVAVGRSERHRNEAQNLRTQVDLIGAVAPTVQQSLDLSDVLPAIAVQLQDHFGLSGVRVAASVTGSEWADLFGIGVRPDPGVEPQLLPPEQLAAGKTVCLALQRGGRSVAVLSLVAGQDLGALELRSLRALVELVTAAIVNAALFASQQEALRELRELDALKTVFLGTASHELRTPATTITGFASLLAGSWDDLGDEQRRTFAARIEANARSLSAVVQDLLDFALLDRGRLALNIETVDLEAVVGAVVDRLGAAMPDHEIVLGCQAAPLVAGDVNGIERILTNLLTNAAKYSPPGTTIAVEVGAAEGVGFLAVSDQGAGVPEGDREKIFTRFFRGAGDEVVQTRGVGIGLSVVAELVERMEGEVKVDDAPGGGARFAVRLPLAATVDHPAADEEPDTQRAEEDEDATAT